MTRAEAEARWPGVGRVLEAVEKHGPWRLDGPCLRYGSRDCCPLTVDCGVPALHADVLKHVSTPDTGFAVVFAADATIGHDPALRALLLSAAGLA